MKRLFWVVVGAGAAVWTARKAQEVRQRYSPPAVVGRAVDDLSARATGVADRVRSAASSFSEDLRTAAARREEELHAALLSDGQVPAPRVRESAHAREQRRTAARYGARPADGAARPGQHTRVDPDDDDGDLPYSF